MLPVVATTGESNMPGPARDPDTEVQAYPVQRGRLLLLVLVNLLFVGFSVMRLAQLGPRALDPMANGVGSDVERIIYFAGLVFFGALLPFSLRRLLTRDAGLIIDADGFTDRTAAIAPGRISWVEVVDLSIVRSSNQVWIGVSVVDLEAHVARLGAPWRWVVRGNVATGYPPVLILTATIGVEAELLLARMRRALDRSRARVGRDGGPERAGRPDLPSPRARG
jgi:hypothetical protein